MSSQTASAVNVRFAVPEDASALAELILELAAFQRIQSGVSPDKDKLESLIRAFDPASPRAFIFAVEFEGSLIGFAVCCSRYSTFSTDYYICVENAYVIEKHRKIGIEKLLCDAVALYADRVGGKQPDLEALQWNPAVGFCERRCHPRR